MLEKPDLPNEQIIAAIRNEYQLTLSEVAFLPIGADFRTAVYRATTPDETPYFLKLRKGSWQETSVTLPKFLYDQGVNQIIPPLPTQNGRLWGSFDKYKTILYPFIAGYDGYVVDLEPHHWPELAAALKQIHTADVPTAIRSGIRQETYTSDGRDVVKHFLQRVEVDVYTDPIAIELAAFLQSKRAEIVDLVSRAENLAWQLKTQPRDWVVCHSDLHAGNLHIGTDSNLYIVDWDEPILAPKERDLMYIGAGLLASGLTPQEEEQRFYPAYGDVQINETALAYYRYERIIQDIMEYCKELLLSDEGGEERAQSLFYLKSNFDPNYTIEIAYQGDKTR
jgi:spectinomycin phosphotransferase